MAAGRVGAMTCLSCDKSIEKDDDAYHANCAGYVPDRPSKVIRAWVTRQRILGFITREQAAFAEEMAADMERRR